MKSLYLLTEDDSDDLLYEAFLEKLTGLRFSPVGIRLRKGSGAGAVRASLRLVLSLAAKMQGGSEFCLLIAMDNDRAPNAAAADALSGAERSRLTKSEARQSDRYAMICRALSEHLGTDRERWSVPVAVAVPVEMIESWLLLAARGGEAANLPRFAHRDSASARHFHAGGDPPLQIKDLSRQEREAAGFDRREEWALHLIVEKFDPVQLSARSPSFALFAEWCEHWKRQ